MLNIFPIQWLSLFAYAILRVFVGSVLVYLGFTHFKHRDELKHVLKLSWWPFGYLSTLLLVFFEIVAGVMYILGAYTQIAALIAALMALEMLIFSGTFVHHTIPRRITYVLLLAASISLFITGAGAPAFDLPL